jgi:hypothetical protein
LNHDISVPAGVLSPGQAAALSPRIYPLREGQLDLCSVFVVDVLSGEVFSSGSAFRMLIQP